MQERKSYIVAVKREGLGACRLVAGRIPGRARIDRHRRRHGTAVDRPKAYEARREVLQGGTARLTVMLPQPPNEGPGRSGRTTYLVEACVLANQVFQTAIVLC